MFRIVIQFLSCNLLRNGAGFVFKEWWDLSAEAGPQSRPGEQFSEPKPQMEVLVLDSAQNALKFFSCNQESLFKFESFNSICIQSQRLPDDLLPSLGDHSVRLVKAVQTWNEDHALAMRGQAPEGGSQPPTPSASVVNVNRGTPRRTRCSPAFTPDDQPKNLQKVLEPATVLSETAFSTEMVQLVFKNTVALSL